MTYLGVSVIILSQKFIASSFLPMEIMYLFDNMFFFFKTNERQREEELPSADSLPQMPAEATVGDQS